MSEGPRTSFEGEVGGGAQEEFVERKVPQAVYWQGMKDKDYVPAFKKVEAAQAAASAAAAAACKTDFAKIHTNVHTYAPLSSLSRSLSSLSLSLTLTLTLTLTHTHSLTCSPHDR